MTIVALGPALSWSGRRSRWAGVAALRRAGIAAVSVLLIGVAWLPVVESLQGAASAPTTARTAPPLPRSLTAAISRAMAPPAASFGFHPDRSGGYRTALSSGVPVALSGSGALAFTFASSGSTRTGALVPTGVTTADSDRIDPVRPGVAGAVGRWHLAQGGGTARAVAGPIVGVREMVTNTHGRLEQRFVLAHPPSGRGGTVAVTLATRGDLAPGTSLGHALTLVGPGGVDLTYGAPTVTDATGRVVRSWLAVTGRDVEIEFAGRGIRYPVDVDPTISSGSVLLSDGGDAVALSANGKVAIVGGDENASSLNGGEDYSGKAWVFVKIGSGWVGQSMSEYGLITAAINSQDGSLSYNSGDQFGAAVAITGDGAVAVIGAPHAGSNRAGEVWVVSLHTTSNTVSFKLDDVLGEPNGGYTGAGDEFGAAVAVTDPSGSIDVAIGAPGGYVYSTTLLHLGKGYVFEGVTPCTYSVAGVNGCTYGNGNEENDTTPTGQLSDTALTPTSGGFSATAGLGTSIAINAAGTAVLIGAPMAATSGGTIADGGVVDAFTNPSLIATEVAVGTVAGGELGTSVALTPDGRYAVAGAPDDGPTADPSSAGDVEYLAVNSNYAATTVGPASPVAGEGYGTSVAISSDGSEVLVGAPEIGYATGVNRINLNSPPAQQGSAFVESGTPGAFSSPTEQTVASPDPGVVAESGYGLDGEYFGEAVALSADGATAVTGAPEDNEYGSNGPGDTFAYALSTLAPETLYATADSYSGGSSGLDPVDLESGVAGTPVPTDADPEGTVVSPDGDTVFTVSQPLDSVTSLNVPSEAIDADLSLTGYGHSCYGAAISPDGTKLYVTCTEDAGSALVPAVVVINVTAGGAMSISTTIPLATHSASCLSIVVVPGGTVGYDVCAGSSGGNWGVVPLNLVNDTAGAIITNAAFGQLQGVAITASGSTLYVGDYAHDKIFPIALPAGTVGSPISLAAQPVRLAVNATGSMLYVGCTGGVIIPVNLGTGVAGTAIDIPGSTAFATPAMVISPSGATLYATANDAELYPIDLTGSAPVLGSGIALPTNDTAALVIAAPTEPVGPSVTAISPTSGSPAGGTTVTITGTGFTAATAVDFGGVAAMGVTDVSDTEVTAVSPAGSGTLDVTVTGPGGASAISVADQYSYLPWSAGLAASTAGNAATTAEEHLNAVSCPAVGDCSSVGYYTVTGGAVVALAIDESGGTWGSATEIALPGNAVAANASGGADLTAISCPSVGNCTAVGSYAASDGTNQGLAVDERSGVWQTGVEIAMPSGSQDGTVDAVACSTDGTGGCAASGQYADASYNYQGFVASRTSSSAAWGAATEVTLPANAVGGGNNPAVDLGAIACSTTGNCAAVGVYWVTSFQTAPLVVAEVAGSWGAGFEPTLPSDGSSFGAAALDAVACPSVGNCSAAGNFTTTTSGYTDGLIVAESGGTWHRGTDIVASSSDAIPDQQGATLTSIACPVTGRCTAVGWYTASYNVTEPLSADQGVSGWGTGNELALSADATANRTSYLTTLSCPSVGDCTAAGNYYGPPVGIEYGRPLSSNEAYVIDERSGAWASGTELAMPSGAVSDDTVAVGGISCAAPDACGIVGTYQNSTGVAAFVESSTPVSPVVTGVSPATGTYLGGTAVTITGSGFTGATAVDFGATAATSLGVVSDTEITVVSPAGSGTVDVTVTGPDGTSTTSASDHFIYPTPPPVVTGLSPSSGSVTGGGVVTISGSGLSGATVVHFGTTTATGLVAVSATEVTVTAPAGTGTVPVTVTSGGATSAVSSASEYTYTPAWGASSTLAPPAGARVGGVTVLDQIRCQDVGECSAVGTYIDASGNPEGFAATESATTWSPSTEITLPGDAGAGAGITFVGLACSSPGNCTAIGSYGTTGDFPDGLIVAEIGGVWQPGVALVAPGGGAGTLTAVACPPTGPCAAAGDYRDGGGTQQAFIVTEGTDGWPAATATEVTLDSPSEGARVGSISCPVAGECSAVGSYTSNHGYGQGFEVDEYPGSHEIDGYTLDPPSDGQTSGDDESDSEMSFHAISCPAAYDCTAVGAYTNDSGQQAAFTLDESDGDWDTPVGLDLPANASSTATNGELTGVSCTALGSCAAVGSYENAGGEVVPLVADETIGNDEEFGTWGAGIEVALPPGATSTSQGALTALSCTSATFCAAVGSYSLGGGRGEEALAVDEYGGSWQDGVALAAPSDGATPPTLLAHDVSCSADFECTIAGEYFAAGGGEEAFTAALAAPTSAAAFASGWATAQSPPYVLNGHSEPANLQAISCWSVGNCLAVGQITYGGQHAALEYETDGEWDAVQEVRNLPTPGAGDVDLTAVWCVPGSTDGTCVAVGSYSDDTTEGAALMLTISDNRIVQGSIALPAGATDHPDVAFNAISCSSNGASCTAVGAYTDDSGTEGLVLDATGSDLEFSSVSTSEVDLAPTGAATADVTLASVSCSESEHCTAVGTYASPGGATEVLVVPDTSDPVGDEAALPGNAAIAGQSADLASVSCSDDGVCSAVGGYVDDSGDAEGLLYSLDGGVTSALEAVLPAGSDPATAAPDLSAVSCTTAGNCDAIGEYTSGSGTGSLIAIEERSGSWREGAAVALPPGAGSSSYASSISCAAAGECAAVGTYNPAEGQPLAWATTEEAGAWEPAAELSLPDTSDLSLPDTSGAVPTDALSGVSCAAIDHCSAVGSFTLAGDLRPVVADLVALATPEVEDASPSTVVAGTSATVNVDGSGLEGSYAVEILDNENDVLATVSTDVTDDSDAFFTVPNSLTPGEYSFVFENALAASAADDGSTFILTAPPRPVVDELSTASGPLAGGAEVSIYGENFTAVSQVVFGTVPATSFTVERSDTIVAMAPPSSTLGVVDIAVSGGGETSAVNVADEFTYATQNACAITEFSGDSVYAPEGITEAGDGNLWFADPGNPGIGVSSPSGTVSEFPVSENSTPLGIVAGPDGNLWSTDEGTDTIDRITNAGSVTTFGLPNGTSPDAITSGPDGNLWFTDPGTGAIGRITTGGVVTEFGLPTDADPTGITSGPDGNLWFADPGTGTIGRITTSGTVSEFPLPSAASPNAITSGPDGNLWFTDEGTGMVGRITTTGTVTEFGLPPFATPDAITAGSNGNLWFTDSGNQSIGEITTSGQVSEFPIPSQYLYETASLDGITSGPDGTIWFTDGNNEYFGTLAPSGCTVAPTVSALNVTSAPPSGGTAITITGSGFTAASGVALTGISRAPLPLLDVVVVNDTTVTATLPALGSGVLSDIGAVVVTGPGGSSSDALSFADTVRYVPTVTALSASSGPVSGGGVVAISGAGLSDTTAVDFGASAASYVDVVSDGEVIVLVPPSGASGTVDVTVHAEGVSATSPADQYTYSTLSGSGSIVAPSSPPAVGSTSGTNTSTDPGAAATSGAQSPAVGAPVTPTSSSPAVAPPPTVPTAAEGHAARYAGRPCLLLSKSELAAFGVAAQCARAATVTNGTTKISRATWGRVGPATPAISVTVWYVGGADPGATIRSLRSMYAAQGTVRLGRSVREQLPAAAGGRAAAEIVIGRYFCVVQESGTNRSVAQSIRAIGRASRSIAAAL